jgi:hypothetical protein
VSLPLPSTRRAIPFLAIALTMVFQAVVLLAHLEGHDHTLHGHAHGSVASHDHGPAVDAEHAHAAPEGRTLGIEDDGEPHAPHPVEDHLGLDDEPWLSSGSVVVVLVPLETGAQVPPPLEGHVELVEDPRLCPRPPPPRDQGPPRAPPVFA